MKKKFMPVVYEHAAAFIGKSPWEVSRSGELLYQSHREAYEYYHHSPITVGIDIYNLEAEAYGSPVEDPGGNNIPCVRKHLFSSAKEIKSLTLFDPAGDGRVPMIIQAARRLKETYPDGDVRIPVSGPFSVAVNLVGIENLVMEAFTEGETVREALEHLGEGQVIFGKAVREAGLGITFFESAATPPMISPELFAEVELPVLKRTMDRLAEITGSRVPCIMGGDTAPVAEYLLQTDPGFLICPAETDQRLFMEKMNRYPEIPVRINMNAGIIANGTWEEITREADRVLDLVETRDNVLIGPGVLAYNTPPENVTRLGKYITERIN